MSMAVTLIITGGEGPNYIPVSLDYDFVIASDSGYDKAKELNIVPDLVLGDMDSTNYLEEIKDSGALFYPRDKDYSDTELAIKHIESDEYILIGGGGGRIDHLLAIMALFYRYPAPKFWITADDIIIRCDKTVKLNLPIGSDISIMPISSPAKVDSDGLKWELGGYTISNSSISLSNRSEKEEVVIHTSKPVFIRLPIQLLSIFEKMLL